MANKELEEGIALKLDFTKLRKVAGRDADVIPAIAQNSSTGEVLILGRTGSNFAAGMTGGVAYVLDMNERFDNRVNHQSVTVQDIDCSEDSADVAAIKRLLERHVALTDSAWGKKILEGFDHFMFYFRVVRPKVDKEAMKQGGTVQSVPLKVVG